MNIDDLHRLYEDSLRDNTTFTLIYHDGLFTYFIDTEYGYDPPTLAVTNCLITWMSVNTNYREKNSSLSGVPERQEVEQISNTDLIDIIPNVLFERQVLGIAK